MLSATKGSLVVVALSPALDLGDGEVSVSSRKPRPWISKPKPVGVQRMSSSVGRGAGSSRSVGPILGTGTIGISPCQIGIHSRRGSPVSGYCNSRHRLSRNRAPCDILTIGT